MISARLLRRDEVVLALALRQRVFGEEQGITLEYEVDPRDDDALHLGVFDGDTLVGVGRCVMVEPTIAKLGRIAVERAQRGRGLGKRVTLGLVEAAKGAGAIRCYLHAQADVEAFYTALGFVAEGQLFEEAGIPHRYMSRAV